MIGDANDGVSPQLFLNMDTTSILLEEPQTPDISLDKSLKRLQSNKYSCTKTAEIPQKRSISLIATTTADGTLLCTIVVIKDISLDSITKFQVLATLSGLI